MVALNQFDNALVTFSSGASIAGEQNESLNAKILFMTAVVRELQGDLAAAKQAWNTYVRYAKSHDKAVTYIASASARLKAIERMIALDQKYKVVRQRIASNK